MKMAPATFKTKPLLPSVWIEKIRILPTSKITKHQEVEITLSLQDTRGARRLNSRSYMVFVALAHNKGPLTKMVKYPDLVKDLIRSPNKAIGGSIIKRYLKVPNSRIEKMPVARAPGTVVSKKSLTFTHKCLLKELGDLYIYAVTYLTDAKSKSKTGVNRKIKAMKISPPVVETIMIDGKAPLTAAIYTLKKSAPGIGTKGDVWSSNVKYKDGSGLIGVGAYNDVELDVHHVSNQKVQDLRFVNDIKKLPFNTAQEKIKQSSPRLRKELATTKKIVTLPGPVSNCNFSRSKTNELKLSFSVDYDRLAKTQTKLGHFIQNKESLAGCFKVEDIRVYRTLVGENNVKPTSLTAGKISVYGGSIRAPGATEILIASLKGKGLKAIAVRNMTSGVMNFVATDSDMVHYKSGTYEYKIYIDMVDSTVSAVSDIRKKMSKFLADYNKFLAAADSMGEKGFDIKGRLKRKKKQILELQKQWKRLINGYMTSIEFLFGTAAFGEHSSVMWRKNLISMANPGDGDINSMRKVSELVSDFNTNLEKMFMRATTPTSATKFNIRSKMGSQNASKRKVQYEHVFPSKYVRAATPDEGTDYLDDTVTVNHATSLTTMGYKAYEKRMVDELRKFQVPRPNDPGINKFGFMTPKRLFANGSVVETTSVAMEEERGNGILAATLSADTKSRPYTPSNKSPQVYDTEIDIILGSADISMVPKTQPLTALLKNEKKIKLEALSSDLYLADMSSFNKDNIGGVSAISGSMEPRLRTVNSRKQKMRRSRLTRHLVAGKAMNYRRKSKIMPKHLSRSAARGSLAAESIVQAPDSVQLNSSFGNAVNFNAIAKIEYFDGYEIINGVTNLNAPKWRILTEPLFKQFQQEKSRVLCRTVLLNKALEMPNQYKLPEYDSLFVLGDGEVPPTTSKSANWKTQIKSTYNRMKSDMKSTPLNIGDEKSSVDQTYTCVPLDIQNMVPEPARRKSPARPKPTRQKRSRAKKKGGKY
tara:strand:+ start:6817 stop:9774 length:2958 start_codon:yes stop_codon:yes gene_type:complete